MNNLMPINTKTLMKYKNPRKYAIPKLIEKKFENLSNTIVIKSN